METINKQNMVNNIYNSNNKIVKERTYISSHFFKYLKH